MSLKVYYDLMSQPSRAIVLFLKINKIPYVAKPVALRKGEHLTEEYRLLVNPFQKVPAIDDAHFKLSESVAILKYLYSKYKVPEHWYPKDLRLQARVDEYLAWQQVNLRMHEAMVVQHMVFMPRASGKPVDQEKVDYFKGLLNQSISHLENVWLKTTPYLAGNEVTFADLLGMCELEQLTMVGQDFLKDRPVLTAWYNRVKSQLQPHWDETNKVLYKAAANVAAAKQSSKL